jgi:hypothetical protein
VDCHPEVLDKPLWITIRADQVNQPGRNGARDNTRKILRAPEAVRYFGNQL